MFEGLVHKAYHTSVWLAGNYTKEMAQEHSVQVDSRRILLEERFNKTLFPPVEGNQLLFDWERDLRD